MSKISFEGIGEVAATFVCAGEVKAGQTVKLTGSGAVGPCSAGDRFCGVALTPGDEGFATVQVGGLVQVAAAEGLTEGWNPLLADGNGGVKKDSAASSTGGDYLVISVDSGSAVVRL